MLSACHLFSQLRVLVSVRNNGTNFAWHSYVICFRWGLIGHWWMFEKLPQNLNTSNNSPYPQPISLPPHIWQPQSFPFKHKYCSSLRRRPSHGNPLPSLKRHPPSPRSPKNKLTSPLASRQTNYPGCDIFIYHSLDKGYLWLHPLLLWICIYFLSPSNRLPSIHCWRSLPGKAIAYHCPNAQDSVSRSNRKSIAGPNAE